MNADPQWANDAISALVAKFVGLDLVSNDHLLILADSLDELAAEQALSGLNVPAFAAREHASTVRKIVEARARPANPSEIAPDNVVIINGRGTTRHSGAPFDQGVASPHAALPQDPLEELSDALSSAIQAREILRNAKARYATATLRLHEVLIKQKSTL